MQNVCPPSHHQEQPRSQALPSLVEKAWVQGCTKNPTSIASSSGNAQAKLNCCNTQPWHCLAKSGKNVKLEKFR